MPNAALGGRFHVRPAQLQNAVNVTSLADAASARRFVDKNGKCRPPPTCRAPLAPPVADNLEDKRGVCGHRHAGERAIVMRRRAARHEMPLRPFRRGRGCCRLWVHAAEALSGAPRGPADLPLVPAGAKWFRGRGRDSSANPARGVSFPSPSPWGATRRRQRARQARGGTWSPDSHQTCVSGMFFLILRCNVALP